MLPDIMVRIAEFLQTPILSLGWFVFDYWMIIHTITGGLISLVVKKWYWVLLLLVIYEVFEISFYGILFAPETKVNIFLDIVFGMIGFFTLKYLVKR